GSGIFKSENPSVMAKAIVRATTYYDDPEILLEVSRNLGEAMMGLQISQIDEMDLLQKRGI
ncbi:unnamed protein product, partial [marine sediment metagenome]